MKLDLHGKTVVVTGATSGIGLEAAKTFARHGAFTIGVGRSESRNQEAEEMILGEFPDALVHYLLADLAQQRQVRNLAKVVAETIHDAGKVSLDVLVNNAGVSVGRFTRTPDGIERTLAVNHLAPFLLTHELLPMLKESRSGRVLTISSNSHTWVPYLNVAGLNRRPFFYFTLITYQNSKLANILFTLALRKRIAGTSVRAFVVDPGLVNTGIGGKENGAFVSQFWASRRQKGAHPEVPVRTVLFLATEDSVVDSKAIYWRDSKPKDSTRLSLDEDLAEELWSAFNPVV